MQRFVLALLLTTFLCTSARAQKKARPWTDADRYTYAHRNDDPTLWDTTMLREDLESHLEPPFWPTKPAIAEIPSPVADYDWGYCAMRNLETTIGDRKLVGWNIAYASDTFRQVNFASDEAYYQTYFTLLILTDWPQSPNCSGHIVSRNYPHYLATGKQKSSTGDIDWVQMNLADGQNFAIVSQRYFDLNFGQTILVAQQTDGSLRLKQLDLSPGEVLLGGQVPGLEDFLTSLSKTPDVIRFFNHPKAVK